MKLYMFRTVRLSLIRSLSIVHTEVEYVIQVCRQLSNRTRMELRSILVLLKSSLQICVTYTIADLQWINSWWWTDELSETFRVSWKNEFVKLVHLLGFVTKKNLTYILFLTYAFEPSYADIFTSPASCRSRRILRDFRSSELYFRGVRSCAMLCRWIRSPSPSIHRHVS
jgi:hypothetical protein